MPDTPKPLNLLHISRSLIFIPPNANTGIFDASEIILKFSQPSIFLLYFEKRSLKSLMSNGLIKRKLLLLKFLGFESGNR